MSHVASNTLSCRMSNLRNALCCVTIFHGHIDKPYMTHVDFKKWLCHHVEFRGQEQYNFSLLSNFSIVPKSREYLF